MKFFCKIQGQTTNNLQAGPRNYLAVLETGGRMEGLMTAHHLKRFPEALAALTQLLSEGKLHYREQIFDDLEQAPAALLSLFDGSSFGKVLVRL